MPQLTNHKQLSKCQALPFCYLCGEDFVDTDISNKDHVPPRRIFDTQDRNPPLILPTHKKCNGDQSYSDEIIGQLIAVSHGKVPGSNLLPKRISKGQIKGAAEPTGILENLIHHLDDNLEYF